MKSYLLILEGSKSEVYENLSSSPDSVVKKSLLNLSEEIGDTIE
jgi:hypothetical protein